MVANKTVTRLQDAADLLALVEEAPNSCGASRTSVNSGLKLTVRAAREAVLRSFVELRREAKSEVRPNYQPTSEVPRPTPPSSRFIPSENGRARNENESLSMELEKLYQEERQLDEEQAFSVVHERLLDQTREPRTYADRMVHRTGE